MSTVTNLPRYDRLRSYDWNYDHAPNPVEIEVPALDGRWQFCGLPVNSPLGIPAGPLLNGRWCLYYASLGFDVVTYKTVRSRFRECYPLPNLQPVASPTLRGGETDLPASASMTGSWAVSYGMPSKEPDVWRADIESTRNQLPDGKILSVSVVGTIQEGWSIEDLADDYAVCARWALDSGADCIETNFSCPNVSTCDGQLFQQPRDAAVVASRVRQAIGDAPYIAKIGWIANDEDAEALLSAIGNEVDALAMTNSIASTIVGEDGGRMFDGEQRGICGEATRVASTSQVRTMQKLIEQLQLDIQTIGVGGASSAQDVHDYLDAGAHGVHMATAAMIDPEVGIKIRREF